MQSMMLPAEWTPQDGVILTFPHEKTDWKPILDEVISCFVSIVKKIIQKEKLVIICVSVNETKDLLGNTDFSRIIFREFPSNDSWVRDHGPLSIFIGDKPCILDFNFNGWGLKFPANYDNQITRRLYASKVFAPTVGYKKIDMVLEGGSIESDGDGTLLTTTRCLLSLNRNESMTRFELENTFKEIFGVKRVLWLNNGFLSGDDTDTHIDTLARFCNRETIAYVQCTDKNDEHFEELSLMEKELKTFQTLEGNPYRLVSLPMPEAVYYQGKRLPTTYANFLIINNTVLMPTYNSYLDEIAQTSLQEAFFDKEIVGINCLPLIKQHGSLHCVTMQIPKGFLL